MRIACLVVLVSLLAASAAMAYTYSYTAYVGPPGSQIGENWISVPGVPFNPSPDAVFGAWADDYRLVKLDPVTQSGIGWASYDPAFNILLGEGYKLTVDDGMDHPFSYQGVASGVPDSEGKKTDMWISLPGQPGAPISEHWIGHPFLETVEWVDIQVTDGTQTISVQDAVANGWLEGYWQYLDAPTQSGYAVDPDGILGDTFLSPWHMYKVLTYKNNIALIIPAPA